MIAPVLVTAADPIVTAAQAMRQCRIDADALDAGAMAEVTTLLEGYIAAATALLEGWNGILGGVCLGLQTWRQDYDDIAQCLSIPLAPVTGITSVTWRDSAGQVSTIDPAEYSLRTLSGGWSVCRFRDAYALPSDLDEVGAVSITFTAGYETVPAPIVQAILLTVGAWYENREETVIGVSAASLPEAVAVDRLVGAYKRVAL
ncbi:head-tail connector protein [Ciceribacter ferrooxidans]|uniref:PhiE125 gp8 family phage protein n=1 Tax=Ciceribacter ferrooxidans TaxID=2509717 RepID=A0A4Q2T0G7_9HYPH|nr:hypothetical protein [Ciceribacter ferrooxidans]RYC10069.1 hypothetical protein EUU22_18520 [Ciceribacter ferrooxidans]